MGKHLEKMQISISLLNQSISLDQALGMPESWRGGDTKVQVCPAMRKASKHTYTRGKVCTLTLMIKHLRYLLRASRNGKKDSWPEQTQKRHREDATARQLEDETKGQLSTAPSCWVVLMCTCHCSSSLFPDLTDGNPSNTSNTFCKTTKWNLREKKKCYGGLSKTRPKNLVCIKMMTLILHLSGRPPFVGFV